jgi:hypothetical protein
MINWFRIATSGTDTIDVPGGTTLRNVGVLGAVGVFNPGTLQVDVAGKFENDGLVVAAGEGTVVLAGIGGTNNGTEEATAGGRLQIEEVTVNKGRIGANGAVTTIENTMTQQNGGEIDITNNGTLIDTGNVSGGTININSGTLRLEGPAPLHGLAATVAFTGRTGTIVFGGIGLTEHYSNILHSLVVDVTYAPGETGQAEIALPATGFSAANFDVVGQKVVYTAHPTS